MIKLTLLMNQVSDKFFNEVKNLEKIKSLNEDELFDLVEEVYEQNEPTNINKRKQCKCLNNDQIIEDYEKGIIVCKKCGIIIQTILDSSPEWCDYGSDGKKGVARCSYITNNFLPQSSLGTDINCYKNRMKILHIWGAMPYKERSLHKILKDVENKCRKSSVSKYIEDDVKILCTNISKLKHLRGKNKGKSIITRGDNRKGIIAACYFYACKRDHCTKSKKEVAELWEIEETDVTKGCKVFLKLVQSGQISYTLNTESADYFIVRFYKQRKGLPIKKKYIAQALIITQNIKKLNIASVHNPISVAAGSILLSVELNNLNITKKNIAKRFSVSEVTITKTYDKIKKYKKILINTKLVDVLVKKRDEKINNMDPPERFLRLCEY